MLFLLLFFYMYIVWLFENEFGNNFLSLTFLKDLINWNA